MFPLCQRPGSVAVLDDDPVFLDMVQQALSRSWGVAAFEDADEFRDHLQADGPFWEVDVWLHHEAVSRWRAGAASLAAGVVDLWRRQTERYACTRVCLIDYKLQDRTGLDVLRNLGDWKGRRVLVTGSPSAEVREAAFTSGLIDDYCAKSNRLLPGMSEMVRQYQLETDPRLQRLWASTLSEAQMKALGGSGAAEAMAKMIPGHFVEHVVLADPFGVLCLRGNGALGWLALSLEPTAGKLSDRALRLALELPAEGDAVTQAVPLSWSGHFYGAFFEVATGPDFELPTGYDTWLRRRQKTGEQQAAPVADQGRAQKPAGAPLKMASATIGAFDFEHRGDRPPRRVSLSSSSSSR